VVVDLLAHSLLVSFEDGLAAGLGRAFETPAGEVAGRKAAGFAHDVDQRRRSIGIQRPFGLCNGVGPQRISQFLAPLIHEGRVGHFDARRSLGVEDNKLQSFAGHDRAHTAAPRIAARSAFQVVEDDAGVGVAIFAGHSDAGYRYFGAELLKDLGEDVVEILPHIGVGRLESDRRLVGAGVPIDAG